jgi:AcrR family transcriptional regulator
MASTAVRGSESMMVRSRTRRRDRAEPRSRQRREARATELMRVALRLFAVKDFAKITIKDIAQASGFDSALIYYYFEDKEDLFNHAVKFALSEALDAKQRVLDAVDDPVIAIRNWFAHCLEMADQNRILFKIMFHNSGSTTGSAELSELVQEFYASEENDILADNIKRGVESGIFHSADPLRLSRFVSVHLDGITVASIMRQPFDLAGALSDLEQDLWVQLGYGVARNRQSRIFSFPPVRR